MILRHTYTRNRGAARAALRYYQMRPRGEDEPARSFFDADEDRTLTRDEVNRLLDEHQGRAFLAHRLMLSPSEEEAPEDLRALTRQVMRGLERAKGRELHWVAVEHRNTDHPHVHIVLCGAAREEDGRTREVRLDRADHTRIKEDGRDYCREEARDRESWERALERAERVYEPELGWDEEEPADDRRSGRDRDRDDWEP